LKLFGKNELYKILKNILLVLMPVVIALALLLPVVKSPNGFFELPLIPGLEHKSKIIFFHVPTAWVSVLAFLMSMTYSILYLYKRKIEYDYKSYAAIYIGFIFCIIATITGSIWAKFTWGAFWHWDPRETSIFVLLLIYGAIFTLRNTIENEDKRAILTASYSIIAFVSVPFFVFILPRIASGLHPGSGNDVNSGPLISMKINGNMFVIFMLALLSFTILYYLLWNIYYRVSLIERKINQIK